jgi:hypothetical protein
MPPLGGKGDPQAKRGAAPTPGVEVPLPARPSGGRHRHGGPGRGGRPCPDGRSRPTAAPALYPVSPCLAAQVTQVPAQHGRTSGEAGWAPSPSADRVRRTADGPGAASAAPGPSVSARRRSPRFRPTAVREPPRTSPYTAGAAGSGPGAPCQLCQSVA